MQSNFDYSQLKQAVILATTNAFTQIQALTQNQQLYVFGLYVCREGTSIAPAANTEADLLQVAQAYACRYNKSVSLYQQALRWSPWDWSHYLSGQDFYQAVEALLESTWSEADYQYLLEADRVFQLCREVLVEMDLQGIFGSGQAREQMVVGLFKYDQTQADLLEQARYLNSKTVCDRLEIELQQGYAAFFRK